MSETEKVSLYGVAFKGLYGRNRKVKFTSKDHNLPPADAAADPGKLQAWVSTLAADFARKIGARLGVLTVKRYDDCEVSSYQDGERTVTTYTIPLLDSATVLRLEVA